MTSTASHPNLLDLAKQGNAYAIGALMNRQLQLKGITAKAALKDSCLQIMLESKQVPNSHNNHILWLAMSVWGATRALVLGVQVQKTLKDEPAVVAQQQPDSGIG